MQKYCYSINKVKADANWLSGMTLHQVHENHVDIRVAWAVIRSVEISVGVSPREHDTFDVL
jgi:hypothetical protein